MIHLSAELGRAAEGAKTGSRLRLVLQNSDDREGRRIAQRAGGDSAIEIERLTRWTREPFVRRRMNKPIQDCGSIQAEDSTCNIYPDSEIQDPSPEWWINTTLSLTLNWEMDWLSLSESPTMP